MKSFSVVLIFGISLTSGHIIKTLLDGLGLQKEVSIGFGDNGHNNGGGCSSGGCGGMGYSGGGSFISGGFGGGGGFGGDGSFVGGGGFAGGFSGTYGEDYSDEDESKENSGANTGNIVKTIEVSIPEGAYPNGGNGGGSTCNSGNCGGEDLKPRKQSNNCGRSGCGGNGNFNLQKPSAGFSGSYGGTFSGIIGESPTQGPNPDQIHIVGSTDNIKPGNVVKVFKVSTPDITGESFYPNGVNNGDGCNGAGGDCGRVHINSKKPANGGNINNSEKPSGSYGGGFSGVYIGGEAAGVIQPGNNNGGGVCNGGNCGRVHTNSKKPANEGNVNNSEKPSESYGGGFSGVYIGGGAPAVIKPGNVVKTFEVSSPESPDNYPNSGDCTGRSCNGENPKPQRPVTNCGSSGCDSIKPQKPLNNYGGFGGLFVSSTSGVPASGPNPGDHSGSGNVVKVFKVSVPQNTGGNYQPSGHNSGCSGRNCGGTNSNHPKHPIGCGTLGCINNDQHVPQKPPGNCGPLGCSGTPDSVSPCGPHGCSTFNKVKIVGQPTQPPVQTNQACPSGQCGGYVPNNSFSSSSSHASSYANAWSSVSRDDNILYGSAGSHPSNGGVISSKLISGSNPGGGVRSTATAYASASASASAHSSAFNYAYNY